jgi:hypothetical protein
MARAALPPAAGEAPVVSAGAARSTARGSSLDTHPYDGVDPSPPVPVRVADMDQHPYGN